MTTTTRGLDLTVTAPHPGAGKEAFPHRWRDESLAMIPPLILELSGRISRRAALLEASSVDPAQSCDDLAALAWIQGSLEDVEATITGLSEVNRRRSAAFGGPAPFFCRKPGPLSSAGASRSASIKAPVAHAGGFRSSLPAHGQMACPQY